MRQILSLVIFCLAVGSFQSCVSKKKYDDLAAQKAATDQALAETQDKVSKLEDDMAAQQADFQKKEGELKSSIDKLSTEVESTKTQVASLEKELGMTKKELDDLKAEINGIFGAYKNSGLALEEKNGKLYVVTSNPVQYRSGSIRLSKDERAALDELAETLKNNPKLKVLVEGHTDDQKLVEGAAYQDNWELGSERALGVVRYLVRQGVANNQVSAVSRGDSMPVGDNEDAEGRSQNRRTVVSPDPDLSNIGKGN